MTSAELVFRDGFGPIISTTGLRALLAACESDDKRLIQGSTSRPPPLMCVQDWPVEAACLIGFCGWADHDMASTVGAVEEYFATKCFQADQTIGEPSASRWLLNFWDDTPRVEARNTIAAWVRDALATRTEDVA